MGRNSRVDIFDMLGDYGHYTCNVGKVMDKVGISISKMRKLTGLNYEIVKKYYEDKIIRIDKDVLARITYVLIAYGVDPNQLVEYVQPKGESAK